jgi:zeaxanthin glucosyltransferase
MAHIGVLIPGALGHLNPASCLGRELQARGHRVTVFQVLDLEDAVRGTGLEYRATGEEQFPPGRYNDHLAHLGTLKGLAALRYTIEFFAFKSRVLLTGGPDLIRGLGINLLLVDEVEPGGAIVAEHLRLPYITLSNALTVYRESNIPPVFTAWKFSCAYPAKIRNTLGYLLQRRLAKDWLEALNLQRRACDLPPYFHPEDFISPRGHLTQQPPCFDYPREHIPRSSVTPDPGMTGACGHPFPFHSRN